MKSLYAIWFALAIAAGCGGNDKRPAATSSEPAVATETPSGDYRATIRWTSHGIPHVVADDVGSVTFGQGYAFAVNHVCELADQIVKVHSERARFFGPGEGDANVLSDFGHLALGTMAKAQAGWDAASDETRAVMSGFAAGYNHYLAKVGADGLPEACRNAPWVQPITAVDVAAHGVAVSAIGSTGYFMESIAGAEAPPMGSNGWGIGADKSATGRGMLVANPHFPWEGALRFYESHLTVPGDFDAYGATLLGLPLVSIGFNEHVAWTHTFSASSRFVVYRMKLVEGSPTKYVYGGETRDMTARAYSIDVKQPDGSLAKVERTLYFTHFGPMLQHPLMAWDPSAGTGFSMRAVTDSPGSSDQYLAMMRANDLDEFRAAYERHQATPFVNTVYADDAGNAWYIDGSAVPDLSGPAIGAWQLGRKAMPALEAAWQRGLVALDGSMPLFELLSDPAAAVPGRTPYAKAPQLRRRDYVMNANDSYWLTNPDEPLTGFSPLYGEAPRAPSARTRMNHALLRGRKTFTRASLEEAITSNRSMTAELLREPVVARCRAAAAKTARLRPACDVLASWDGRYDLDRRGAVLWREFLSQMPQDGLWAEAFDPARPLETPRGLARAPDSGVDPVPLALLAAMDTLTSAGIDPVGATVGDVQFTEKAGRRIAVHGSTGRVGITNPVFYSSSRTTRLPHMDPGTMLNSATSLTDRGYPVNYGTSFLMVVGFEEAGPVARAIMTYSASSDPASPHFADQTEMWSRKQLRDVRYRAADIEADPGYRTEPLTAPRQPQSPTPRSAP